MKDALRRLLGSPEAQNVDSWQAVKKLLVRNWFSRAWIVQEETALDQSKTWIACGTKRMNREIFYTARDILFAVVDQVPVPHFEFM
jgi:hypothetical protein